MSSKYSIGIATYDNKSKSKYKRGNSILLANNDNNSNFIYKSGNIGI